MNAELAQIGVLNGRQIVALVAPVFLIGTMLWAFKGLTGRIGYPAGYFLAFCIYWIGWCLVFPLLILGLAGALLGLFRPVKPFLTLDWLSQLLLWWPIIINL